VPTRPQLSKIDAVLNEQADAAAQDGRADGPNADKSRASKPRLLQKDKCEHAQDKDAGDECISNAVGHVHWFTRGDDFRHVLNPFNETMRRHTSHSRIMQAVTRKLK
jgi:hypothetical protein